MTSNACRVYSVPGTSKQCREERVKFLIPHPHLVSSEQNIKKMYRFLKTQKKYPRRIIFCFSWVNLSSFCSRLVSVLFIQTNKIRESVFFEIFYLFLVSEGCCSHQVDSYIQYGQKNGLSPQEYYDKVFKIGRVTDKQLVFLKVLLSP